MDQNSTNRLLRVLSSFPPILNDDSILRLVVANDLEGRNLFGMMQAAELVVISEGNKNGRIMMSVTVE